MFCDLVDSTELSQRIDPEELTLAIGSYQDLCARRIARHGGTIAQYLGDGLLVYFGYPGAHEDDPARAVQTALEILEEMPDVNARLAEQLPSLRGRPLQIRIGIHTGEVVMGTLGTSKGPLALGDTVNITARLQGEAEAGTVVISDTTQHVVRHLFELESLGPRALKGIEEPLHIYRARSERAEPDAAVVATLTPFVGRVQELSLLLEQWEEAASGAGQIALVSGEPGMGKSRLLKVLRERLEDQPHTWLEGRCSPYYESSALHPVSTLLRTEIELEGEDSPEQRFAKLEEALAPTGLPLEEMAPVVAGLLSIPLPEGHPEPPSNPEVQRRKTLEFLASWLFRLSEDEPVVLVVEDLHWVDPSTLELLSMVIARTGAARLFLVLTFRPGFEPPWDTLPNLRRLSLHPLTRQQMARMIESIQPGRSWSPELVTRLVAKADGVPLFVEELAKAVLESGVPVDDSDGVPDFSIPSTLQSSLTARLDRLGPVREIAQLASVLGREFSWELLEAVSTWDPASLEEGLAELCRAGLLHRENRAERPGEPARADYVFKHALIRDAAYESLLRSACRRIHRRVAQVLERDFPDRAASAPELIARHYDEAELTAEAAVYYQLAAERAAERSANAEAIRHLTRGIEMLSRVPPSPEHRHRELKLQTQLGVLTMAADGAADPGVERVFQRARALCVEIGPVTETGLALFGLSVFHQARGELDTAVELGDLLLALADQTGDSSLQVSASLSLGIPLFWTGQPGRAVEHLERAAALYDPDAHRALAYAYGQDPAVSARSYDALCLWQLGSVDRAAAQNEMAVASADDDLTLAFALTWAAWVSQLRGDVPAVRDYAERVGSLARKRGYVLWENLGAVLRGWAGAVGDRNLARVEELEQALAKLAETGTRIVGPAIAGLYAEALTGVGRLSDAVAALDGALEMAAFTKTPYLDAELRRQKGELLIRIDPSRREDALALFQGSLEEARTRQMRSFELRAATSLARELRRDGRGNEARSVLAGVYDGFSEGFATADLRGARTLLDSLA